jgi:hypothetical protein
MLELGVTRSFALLTSLMYSTIALTVLSFEYLILEPLIKILKVGKLSTFSEVATSLDCVISTAATIALIPCFLTSAAILS